jgi:2-dehydro-3-deoxygalactonokinase
VPGYCYRGEDGDVDVMRGEETQLLGAQALGQGDGWVVLPGTHSKWVLLRDGATERFFTFMTGELFAALAAGGTLAPLIAAGDAAGRVDDGAFAAGVAAARLRAPLSNALFGVRARVVAGVMPAAQARDFVSGLLIGAEFIAARELNAPASLTLLGSPALTVRYASAAALFGMAVETSDAESLYTSALSCFFSIFD